MPSLVPAAAGSPSWDALLGNEEIRAMVGSEAFARGMVYARSGHVVDVALDEEALTVTGRVRGTYRDGYEVTIQLAPSRSGATTVYRSQCTCPVALDCKHAAAVLIVARSTASVRHRIERPEWEKTLTRLLAAPRAEPTAAALPLALEFEVERIPAFRGYAGRQDLRIRPARPGRSGGWVRNGISWEDLDHVTSTYSPEHRELLLQFRAAAGAGARYALPRTPWLSLGTVTSAFWSLLEQAGALGVNLLAAKPLRGPVRAAEPATVSLDARRADTAGLLVGPRVLVGEHQLDLPSVGVLGEPAHGIFTVTPAEDGGEELVVARLESMLSRELRQLVVEARPLMVPAADEDRFLADFLPELRHALPVTSTDGSVALPRSVPPRLELTVRFAPGPQVELSWAARYERDDGVRSFALGGPREPRSGRDPAAEADLLTAPPLKRWLEEGWPVEVARPPAATLLVGAAALTFVDEVVPGLEEAGIVVLLAGQVVDFRRSDAEPSVAVAAVERDGSADWFDLHIEVSLEGEAVPFDQLFVALTLEEEYLVLDTGVYFSLDRPELRRLRQLIEESRTLTDAAPSGREAGELRISPSSVSLWEDLVELGSVLESSVRWTSAVRGLGADVARDPVAVPATLRAELRPYQVEGYRWLHHLWSHELGGILADDMGLGKTLQVLALVCRARAEGRPGPGAPDVPAPDAPAPDARAPDARAPDARAPDARAPDARAPDARAPDARAPDARAPDARAPDARAPDARAPDARAPDARAPDARAPDARAPDGPGRSGPFLVVAPTSVVSSWKREAATFAPALRVVVVTESEVKRSRAGGTSVAELAATADLVVTSYALLRIDVETWAGQTWGGLVLDEAQFVKNHRAKTYASARRVAAPFILAVTGTPLENNLMDLWALLSLTAPGLFPDPDRFSEFYRRPIERGGDHAKLDQLRRRIRPLVLRRTKEAVAPELPAKSEQVVDVVLAPRHLRIYQTHLQRERQKVLGLIDDVEANRFTILASLTLLRQLSLDAALVDRAHAGVPSAKTDLLVDQLGELVAEGHQALVFSQFTSFLGRVRERLDAAGIGYAYLDGRTRNRDRVVQRFRDGEAPVFLISLKAGGFGLNLTEADYCFLLDPWWNPAAEAQAVDRAHRIGQTRTVLVYRMVSADTIEEKVMELKARKSELFDSVLGDDGMAGTALTASDIRALLAG